jgi:hypothetical protein
MRKIVGEWFSIHGRTIRVSLEPAAEETIGNHSINPLWLVPINGRKDLLE